MNVNKTNPLIKQGWLRALLYFIAVLGLLAAVQFIITPLLDLLNGNSKTNSESTFSFGIIYSIMGILVFALTWVMRKFIDRKSFVSLGFEWKNNSNEAGIGFFAALAMLGIGSLILITLGYTTFITSSFDPAAIFFELGLLILVAFIEELLFRGYLLNNLLQSMNKWIALIVSAILFAVFHCTNPDISIFAIINILLAGIFLGLNYIYTRNLWFSIFFHFAWNYTQGPVLGYDVSGLKMSTILNQTVTGPELWTGGAFGFEGSLLCPLLFVIAILIFTLLFKRRYESESFA